MPGLHVHPQPSSPSSASPAASIGYHLRWQVLLALGGIVLLALVLGYSTYSVTTVLAPDRGGVYREGVAGNPKYLNPLLCDATDVDLDLCSLLYRGLTRIDKNGRVTPDLAEGWRISEGVDYVFRLKPDQYWHDGQQVTVDDVIFTVSVLQDPEVYSLPDLTSLWRSVQVEKIDDLQVRFRLTEPFTPFWTIHPSVCCRNTSGVMSQPRIWRRKPLNATPIGNGPLKVVRTAADHIRLEPEPVLSRAATLPCRARTALLPRSRQRLHRLRQRRTGGHQPDRPTRPAGRGGA